MRVSFRDSRVFDRRADDNGIGAIAECRFTSLGRGKSREERGMRPIT